MDNQTLLNLVKLFKLEYVTWDEWTGVHCPFHSDKNKSGRVVFHNEDGRIHGFYKCMAGCFDGSLKELLKKEELFNDNYYYMKNTREIIEHSNNLNNYPYIRSVSTEVQIRKYTDFLEEKGLDQEIITELGGYLDTDERSETYGYLVFKYGLKKECYVGRNIFRAEEGSPRFLNSKSNKYLLGYDSIDKNNPILLLEGLTDWIAARNLGKETGNVILLNSVCSLGSNLSKEQGYQLKGKKVYIIYDPDFAGYQGSEKASVILREFKANPRILDIENISIQVSEKADVNYLCKNHRDEFYTWFCSVTRPIAIYDTDYIKETFLKSEKLVYRPTGIKTFDSVLGGGFTQGIYSFAGNPGIGKSTQAVAFSRALCNTNKILYCTYELTKNQIWSRILAPIVKVNWQQIEKDKSCVEEKYGIYIDKLGNQIRVAVNYTIDDILNCIDYFDVVVIDYLQRMATPKGMEERAGIKYNLRQLTTITEKQGSNKSIILISEIPRSEYHGSQDSLAIFKETGGIEYSSQGCFRLTKIGQEYIDMNVIKNTRGLTNKVIRCEVNYPLQTIKEIDLSESIGLK